jgi:hypothetical protein
LPFLATGAGRWRCKGHRTGTCSNGSVTTSELEDRAFAGIRDKLLTPAVITRFAAALQQELEDMHRTDHVERARAENALAETRARIAKLVTRIEEDDDAPRSLSLRLKELEKTERALEATLATAPERQVVRLPANYGAPYLRAVAELDFIWPQVRERQRVRPSARSSRRSWFSQATLGVASAGRCSFTATCSGCWNWRRREAQTQQSPAFRAGLL